MSEQPTNPTVAEEEDLQSLPSIKPVRAAPSPTGDPRFRTKSNEEMIREEMRGISLNYVNLWRSGIALLASVLIAIGFLRREYLQQLQLVDKSLVALPLDKYLLGTALLALIAHTFSRIAVEIGQRWAWHADLLASEWCANSFGVPPLSPLQRSVSPYRRVFWLVPGFDLYVRAALEFDRHDHAIEFMSVTLVVVGAYAVFDRRRHRAAPMSKSPR